MEIQYYKMNGEFLFSFIKKSGLVSWMNGSKKINLSIDKLQDARLYKDYDIVVILKGEYHLQSQLDIYSINGNLLYEKSEPENYYFSYLTSDGKKTAVVCDGNEKTKDKYGRTTWKFAIHQQTGNLTRISLAY
ncbi:hypothetical protein H9661_10525 [Clostridium sp. Sa3CVN1]|uniref:Uncharacterized protein n=2 Tax=Clostridium cibarium TaxID=2762247 RepID=A0ABR8PUD6_9CLOT|nr:hypothetical protein [Clostridium cibarium]